MLKVYDYLDEVMSIDSISQQQHSRMKYYASEIMDKMGCQTTDEINTAVHRAMQVCHALNIPIRNNFKQIYRNDGQKVTSDWKLSTLASYLLVVNGNPGNPIVARAQIFFCMKKDEKKK